jgi:hypothetical protein
MITPISFEVTKVAVFAEIWNCRLTGEKSLHSAVAFKAGDVVCSFSAREQRAEPSYLTVQVDEQEHILLEPEFLQYINHSCDPNVFFDLHDRVVLCLKEIHRGEAITFFYPSTEWSMEREFECRCGTQQCLGRIRGARYISKDVLKNYQLSKYVQNQLNSA